MSILISRYTDFVRDDVQIETASDAHKQSDVGANILDLANMLV